LVDRLFFSQYVCRPIPSIVTVSCRRLLGLCAASSVMQLKQDDHALETKQSRGKFRAARKNGCDPDDHAPPAAVADEGPRRRATTQGHEADGKTRDR
ncbi:unnamed protein product, partial [Sphacelaria rigidula]